MRFGKKALNPLGSPAEITTGWPASYKAVTSDLGNLPFRRRERAMLRFRQMKSLQRFASVHANVDNHFNVERQLIGRQTYKTRHSATQGEGLHSGVDMLI